MSNVVQISAGVTPGRTSGAAQQRLRYEPNAEASPRPNPRVVRPPPLLQHVSQLEVEPPSPRVDALGFAAHMLGQQPRTVLHPEDFAAATASYAAAENRPSLPRTGSQLSIAI